MNELALKYGCNPNQKPARVFMADGGELPVTVLNGKPGYINFLDALNSWQLVKELKETISGNQATVMQKLLDHFESRSKAEQQASLAEEAEKERAYYESIPDEYKPMYDRLKRLEAAE